MEQIPDAMLVDQARAGDQQAFAELYARWFDPVYDFAARITRDRDEAAAVTRDTFLRAMNTLAWLQEGASFRSWLFTIARNTVLNQLEHTVRTRPLPFDDDDGQAVAFDVVDPGRIASPAEAVEADALASLVWEAAAGLDPKQLSLLDLHLRQGLDSGEIACVMGVTPNNGHVLVNRLKKAVEDAIGAFIVLKGGLRKELVSPLAVYGAFAAVGSPPGVKGQVIDGLLRQWPGPASSVIGGGPSSRAGPPEPPSPPQESWLLGHLLKVGTGLGAAAALLAALLVLPASPVALTRSNGQGALQAGADSPSPAPGDTSPTLPAAPTKATGASPSPTKQATPPGSPSPSQQAAGGPATPNASATNTSTPLPGATATSTPTSAPTPVPGTPTSTRVPCNPQLVTNLSAPLPVAIDGDSFFLLFNSSYCASATFSVSISSGSWLTVLPMDGTLGAGMDMTMSVHVNGGAVPAKEGIYTAVIRISGPGNAVDVTVTTSRGGQPPSILSTSGICSRSPAPGSATFSATVTDDVAVTSVSLRYTESGGVPHNWSMNAGGGGVWTVTVGDNSAFNATGFTIVALDGANHAHNYLFSPTNCT